MDISWVSHGPGEADTGSNNGTARLVTIPSLRLGARYTATIMDLAAEDNLVSFAFSACKSYVLHPIPTTHRVNYTILTVKYLDPNCSLAGGAAVLRVELVCVSLVTNVSHAQAAASCRGRGMALWAGRGTNTEQVPTTTTSSHLALEFLNIDMYFRKNCLPLECTLAHWISRQASCGDFLGSRSKGSPKVLMSKLIYSKCSPINY